MPGVAGLVLALVASLIYFMFRQKQRSKKMVTPLLADSYFREVLENELRRRQADYVVNNDSVVIRDEAVSAELPILPIHEICSGQSREKWPSVIQAYLAAVLSERPIHLGPLSEILTFKDQLDPFDPRRPLLQYHELREIEMRQWVSDPIDLSTRLSPETTKEIKSSWLPVCLFPVGICKILQEEFSPAPLTSYWNLFADSTSGLILKRGLAFVR